MQLQELIPYTHGPLDDVFLKIFRGKMAQVRRSGFKYIWSRDFVYAQGWNQFVGKIYETQGLNQD